MLIKVQICLASFLWRLLKWLHPHIGLFFNRCSSWLLIIGWLALAFDSIVWCIPFQSLCTVLYRLYECIVLCSHKDTLNFLDQLCSLYQHNYILTSAVEVGSTQTFIDKVCELAEANGLPSDGYRSSLSEFSADEVKRHLSEVLVVALPLNIHILVHVRPINAP